MKPLVDALTESLNESLSIGKQLQKKVIQKKNIQALIEGTPLSLEIGKDLAESFGEWFYDLWLEACSEAEEEYGDKEEIFYERKLEYFEENVKDTVIEWLPSEFKAQEDEICQKVYENLCKILDFKI